VPLCLTPRIERIAQAVTGRRESLFAGDVKKAEQDLKATLDGKRVLLVGAAGSIGSATLMELLTVATPSTVAVLDPNENNLAELVRSVRNLAKPFTGELIVQPLDYGTPLTGIFLDEQAPFDVVFSFAALKHVRSERDHFSTVRMLDVNLLKAHYFLCCLRRRQRNANARVFFVSTDKAANPVGIMGASKRAMEILLWAHTQSDEAIFWPQEPTQVPPRLIQVTTARFANVAFSDGSLPWAFLQRIEKQQPLAAPGDIRRYLVTPREAGQLCLLAGAATPHGNVVIPRLDPDKDMASFVDIADATLRDLGLTPVHYRDPAEALARVASDLAQKRYPVLVTTSDTSGEKEIEEFVACGEQDGAHPRGLPHLATISAPHAVDLLPLRHLLNTIHRAERCRDPSDIPSKAELAQALAGVVPGFIHRETGKSLDGKM
jgi:FlaA1/EpsC-like NDP-sugar epimerase